VPDEIMTKFLEQVIQSPIIRENPAIYKATEHKELIAKLQSQVYRLYPIVEQINKHYWPMLVDCEYKKLP
jgi:hypothetical protein